MKRPKVFKEIMQLYLDGVVISGVSKELIDESYIYQAFKPITHKQAEVVVKYWKSLKEEK